MNLQSTEIKISYSRIQFTVFKVLWQLTLNITMTQLITSVVLPRLFAYKPYLYCIISVTNIRALR